MEIIVPVTLSEVVKAIEQEAEKHDVSDRVSVGLDRNKKNMTIKINYWGVSKLVFGYSRPEAGCTSLELQKEELASLHKPKRGEIMTMLKKAARRLGGTVVN